MMADPIFRVRASLRCRVPFFGRSVDYSSSLEWTADYFEQYPYRAHDIS